METQAELTISATHDQKFTPLGLACFTASWSGISKPWHIWSALHDQIERGLATHKSDTLALAFEVPQDVSMKDLISAFKGLQTDQQDADHGCIGPAGIVDIFDHRDPSDVLARALEREKDNIYIGRMIHESERVVELALIRRGSSASPSSSKPNIFALTRTITFNLSDELFLVVKGYLTELTKKRSATVLLVTAPAVRHDASTVNRIRDAGDHSRSSFARTLQGGSMIPVPPASIALPRPRLLPSTLSTPTHKAPLGRIARRRHMLQDGFFDGDEKEGAHTKKQSPSNAC